MSHFNQQKKSPEYWHNLGSSKSRNAQQEKLSKEIIEDLIGNCDAETAVGFTDSSCLGNQGPCGAGACLFIPGAVDPIMLKQPVSNRGSILLGELVAIKLALKHIFQYKTVRQTAIKNVHILSDSQSAVGQLILGWEAKSHQNTLQEVKTIIKQLEQINISVELSWTPGHANIKGNKNADKLAKEAAQEAKEKDDLPPVISLGDVKEAARKSGLIKWQEMWEKSDKDTFFSSDLKLISNWTTHFNLPMEKKL